MVFAIIGTAFGVAIAYHIGYKKGYFVGYRKGDSVGEWRGWKWGYEEGQKDADAGVVYDIEKAEFRRKEVDLK